MLRIGLSALWIASSVAMAANSVQSVRFSDNDTRTRVVLDLNQLPNYSAQKNGSLFSVTIDGLENTNMNALRSVFTERARFSSAEGETLTFLVSPNSQIKHFTLDADAEAGKQARLVVDITAAAKTDTAKVKTEVAPKPNLRPIGNEQALSLFERDIFSIRSAVQQNQIELTEASDLTTRKRVALVEKVATSRSKDLSSLTIHRGRAVAASEMSSRLDRQKKAAVAALVESVIEQKSSELAEAKAAAPAPKIERPVVVASQPKPKRPVIKKTETVATAKPKLTRPVISAANDLMDTANSTMTPEALALFEARRSAIKEALDQGRITRAQAEELLGRLQQILERS